MRRYVGDEKYVVETIGGADDFADADGVETLTFHQAQTKARERAQAVAEEARIASMGPAITVRSAIEEYLTARERREAKDHGGNIGLKRDARSRLTKHVLEANEKLAAKPLAALTTGDLAKWRDGLQMARLRAAHRERFQGGAQRHCEARQGATAADHARYYQGRPGERARRASRGARGASAARRRTCARSFRRRGRLTPWSLGRRPCAHRARARGDGRAVQPNRPHDGRRCPGRAKATDDPREPQGPGRQEFVSYRRARRRRRSSRAGEGDRRPQRFRASVPSPALGSPSRAARWEKGERGPMALRRRTDAPMGCDRPRAGLAAGTIPYALRHTRSSAGSAQACPCAWSRRCTIPARR